MRGLLEESGVFEEIRIEKDLSNNDRIATAKRAGRGGKKV